MSDSGAGYFCVTTTEGKPTLLNPAGNSFFAVAMGCVRNTADIVLVKECGFNSLSLASPDVIAAANLPYMAFRAIRSGEWCRTFPEIITPNGSYPMPDVWSPHWQAAVKDLLVPYAQSLKKDTNLIGYYVDNELGWDTLAVSVLRQAATPSKTHFVTLLERRYGSVQLFNAAWGTSFSSVDAAIETPWILPKTLSAQAQADCEAFVKDYGTVYYSWIKTVLRDYDPNHLYLGSRFGHHTPAAIAACATFADVVSVDCYDPTPNSLIQTAFSGISKPIIISEFGSNLADPGFRQPLGRLDTQAERAAQYIAYVTAAESIPGVVGAAWYSGRDTTEARWGFMDVHGNPYPELVAAAQSVNSVTKGNN